MAARKSRVQKPAVEVATRDEAQSDAQNLGVRPRSLVFISHDTRDADLAELFANLLSDVSGGTLKSFRSSDRKSNAGIEFGAEWYASIMSQLGDATDVVALLTARSLDRPWILYEAGVAKGRLETTVLGLALGVQLEKVSTGPFGQFQNCGDDEDSLTKLVIQLMQRNPDAAPREAAVRMQVRLFIEQIKALPASKQERKAPSGDEQGVAKLFEEVKAMVRELPDRVDHRVQSLSRRGGSLKGRRFHPAMLDEILSLSRGSLGNARGVGLLLIFSMFRDELPWLYEVGMELYRAVAKRDAKGVHTARRQLAVVLDVALSGPLMHDMVGRDEELFYVVRHLPKLIDEHLRASGVPGKAIADNPVA